MEWAIILIWGVLGWLVGGLLNQIIDRAPQRLPIWSPGPACDECGGRIAWRDLVPVYSYLALKGHCRTCGAAIPRRALWVEAATIVIMAGLAWYRGLGYELFAESIYAAFLIVIMVIDLEHRLILNSVVYPAILVTLALAIGRVWLGEPRVLHYAFWQESGRSFGASLAVAGMSSQLAGGLVAFAIFLVLFVFSRGSMGDGDVRLALLGGLIVGYPGALLMVAAAILAAGLVSAGLLITRRVTRKTPIPFGPFLVLAVGAVDLAGEAWLRLVG